MIDRRHSQLSSAIRQVLRISHCVSTCRYTLANTEWQHAVDGLCLLHLLRCFYHDSCQTGFYVPFPAIFISNKPRAKVYGIFILTYDNGRTRRPDYRL